MAKKAPKPGQYCSINGKVYRAKKRTNGCNGCVLNTFVLCPGLFGHIDCLQNGIIITDIQNEE